MDSIKISIIGMAHAEIFWYSGNVLFLNLGGSDIDVLFA